MLVYVQCEFLEGRHPKDASVALQTAEGRTEYLALPNRTVTRIDGRDYVALHLIHLDDRAGRVLVGLPDEADSGAHRLWFRSEQVRLSA